MPVSPVPPVLLGIDEAAAALGVGKTTVKSLVASGDLRSVTVGRRRLVPVEALREFADRLGRVA